MSEINNNINTLNINNKKDDDDNDDEYIKDHKEPIAPIKSEPIIYRDFINQINNQYDNISSIISTSSSKTISSKISKLLNCELFYNPINNKFEDAFQTSPTGVKNDDITIQLTETECIYRIDTQQGKFKVTIPRFDNEEKILWAYHEYRQTRLSMKLAVVMSVAKEGLYNPKLRNPLLHFIHIISFEALRYEIAHKANIMNLSSICLSAHGAIWPYPKSNVYKKHFASWEKRVNQYQQEMQTKFANGDIPELQNLFASINNNKQV